MSGGGLDDADTQQQIPVPAPLAIVAIGGAEGAVPACRALLGSLPAHTGMALVLMLPIPLDQAGAVADLLAGHACLPVLLAQDGAALLPDHCYIIPATTPMLLRQDRFSRTDESPSQAFDALLHSLAETHGRRGIAVLLSGTGRAGLAGIAALRRAGGQVMVQAPNDAEVPDLPANAIATGQADQVLPAPALGAALALAAARARTTPDHTEGLADDLSAQVIQAMRTPIAVLDAQGRVVRANARFEALFQAEPASDALRRHDPTPPESPPESPLAQAMRAAPRLAAFIAASGESPAVEDCIVEVASAESGSLVLRLSATRLRRDPPRILLEALDITDRTRLSARLEMAKAIAEHAQHDRALALASASHDLRQPMQSMSMLHGLLTTKARDPAILSLVSRLDETMDEMSGILDMLVSGERVDFARQAPSPGPVRLQTLFAELDDEFGANARAVGHVWRVVPSHAMVLSDARLLRRILRDHLLQALRSSGQGRILLGARKRADVMRIEIWQGGADSGEAPDEAGDKASESPEVSRLAALMDHPTGLRLRPDGGSRFHIEVPLAPVPDPAASGNRILVIEDDADVADGLVRLLQQHGHTVILARNGGDAISLAVARPPALMITAFNLDGPFNGVELTLRLRQLATPPPPAIILTGDTLALERQDVGLLDVEYLAKPIDPEDLLQRVRRLLRGAEAASVAVQPAADGPGIAVPEPLGHVFIVDDDASLRRDVADWLTANGWQVESFASATEFLQHDHPGRQGCVLVDAVMPGMDGLALLAALHDRASRLPAIMVTGHGDVRMAVRAMAAGAMDFIEKPIRRSELLRSICNGRARIANAAGEAAVRAEVSARLARLTVRQREILDRVIAGSPSKRIAAELNLNQRTVENHRAAIMAKLNARSLPELIRKVVSAGGGSEA